MSQENVEVVRRIWEAADRRDTETVLSLYDSEVELDVSGFPVEAEAGVYRGTRASSASSGNGPRY